MTERRQKADVSPPMIHRRTGKRATGAQKSGLDSITAQINHLIATSRPAPEPIQLEVREAIDRLGAIFRIDNAITECLKAELGIRLLAADSPDVFVYGAKRWPERLILLNCIKEDGSCRVDPSAVHEECAHAIRSVFHPIESPMLQEFFGALGPILALNRRMISDKPVLDHVDTLFRMWQSSGHFEDIPDELANKLKRFLPPNIRAEAESGCDNNDVARGFLENSINHMMPMIAAESMADTGFLAGLMDKYQLMLLPPKEVAEILTDYGRRCALDEAWKLKYKDFRKVCGYYLKPLIR